MAKLKHAANELLSQNLQLLMKLRPELGSQMQLAKKTGVSQSTIGRILRGEVTPSVDAIMSIAREFDVSLSDLYQPHEIFADLVKTEGQSGLKRLHGPISEARQRGLVPLVDWKQAAGLASPSEVKEWVPCPVQINDSLYALEVKGLGMFDPAGALSFREGDRIFVDQKRQAKHRSLVIVHIAGTEEASFRQVVSEEGKWLLLQLNPSLPHRMKLMDDGDRLLGVVVAKVERLD